MRKRNFVFGALGLLLLAGFWLHFHYPLNYVARVLIKQDSDVGDLQWKPYIVFTPALQPNTLPLAPDPGLVSQAFEPYLDKKPLNEFMAQNGSTTLLVSHRGKLLYEAYYHGHTASTLQPTFSVTKSFTGVLLGQAIARGDVTSVDDAMTKYLPAFSEHDPNFQKITLAHLIDMRSGIGFEKKVSFPFFNKDAALVYYGNDLRNILLQHADIDGPPGTFLYNDYNPNIVGMILEKASPQSLRDQFQKHIWDALGAQNSARWSTDYRGFPLLESGFAASARDLLRFGLMMLQQGQIQGNNLIEAEWHQRSTNRAKPHDFGTYDGRQWGYRTGWWLISRSEPPHDYAAIGRFGQFIYVSPRNQTVIVRTGYATIGLGDSDFTAMFFQASDFLNAQLPNQMSISPTLE